MALKLKYKAAEEIPAEVRSLYAERDGTFVLDVDGAVAQEDLEAMRVQAATLTTEKQALEVELTTARTEEAAVAEAMRVGLRPKAVADLRARARAELTLHGGKTARRGQDGTPVPVTVQDWVSEQLKEASHLFEEGTGSGTAGVRSRATTFEGPNPFVTWNLTQQAALRRKDPDLAARLRKEAFNTPAAVS